MDHKEKGFESHAATFTFHFTTTFTTLGFRKKNIFNFLHRSLRHVLAEKKTNFISPLCSRRDDHEKGYFPLLYYYYFIYIQIHKKYNNCCYVHYAVIVTKNVYNFFSALLD